MKLFNSFLVALTVFVFIFPVNAQRPAQKTAKTPLVRCTIPLANSPTVREMNLKMSYFEYKLYMTDVDPTLPRYDDGKPPPFTFSASVIPKPLKPIIFTKEMEEFARNYKSATTIANGNSLPKLTPRADPSVDVKNFHLSFYGRVEPLIYSFQINYSDTLAFDGDQQIKEIFAKSLNIPVGSWVQIQDPDLIQKLITDAIYQITNFTTKTAYPELKFWQADCNGWRAVYITTLENEGLSLILSNSYVVDNLEKLKAASDKEVNDAKRQKTRTGFDPRE
jgi:hypothetical protein